MTAPTGATYPAAEAGPAAAIERLGCVVIGRNEALRLRECLESSVPGCCAAVYVDSGSTDDSVAIARSVGVAVLELDASIPFSAARARNEGFAHLRRVRGPSLHYVQFVDGDCCIEPGWLSAASRALAEGDDLAVVSGGSRERAPSSSLFNLLCDIELDVPPGPVAACGGVAMMRAAAFEQAGGFDAALKAGEEPELCLRLRRLGWRIERLPVPMMRHDAALHGFRQWWARSVRSGRAYAESWWKHRGSPEQYRRREVARILLWGALVPVVTLAAALAAGPAALLCLSGYAVPGTRAHLWARRRGRGRGESLLYGCFTALGKLPECVGVLQIGARRLRGRRRHRTGMA